MSGIESDRHADPNVMFKFKHIASLDSNDKEMVGSLSRRGESIIANSDLIAIHNLLRMTGPICFSCGIRSTPQWRIIGTNKVCLCNACGLRFGKGSDPCQKCGYVPTIREFHMC